MFAFLPCEQKGCTSSAFSLETLCYRHLMEHPERAARSMQELKEKPVLLNRVFDGATFSSMDFSRYRFVGCSFRGAKLQQCMFTGASFHLCFLDTSSFASCDFSGTDIDFCSFGKSTCLDCSFENSEIIHTSFNGSTLVDCTFSGSNLYNSRFVLCDSNSVSFDNCDFKRAFYLPAKETSVTFVGSNIAEAVRDLEHIYL